jgi:hypothetical protein
LAYDHISGAERSSLFVSDGTRPLMSVKREINVDESGFGSAALWQADFGDDLG